MQNKKKIYRSALSYVTNSQFEGHNSIGKFTRIDGSFLGFGSYVGASSKIIKAKIGRFCSIGADVRIIAGTHPTSDFVSTHPSFYSPSNSSRLLYVDQCKYQEYVYANADNEYFVSIGSDVWICSGVRIMQGVTIGDGAVLAAGAIVTTDVEPYAIMGGIPAKVIKHRFSPEQIQQLLQIRWWDKDLDWIKLEAAYFCNIDEFIRRNLEAK